MVKIGRFGVRVKPAVNPKGFGGWCLGCLTQVMPKEAPKSMHRRTTCQVRGEGLGFRGTGVRVYMVRV